jgi:phosphoribosylanthranilate isomerase
MAPDTALFDIPGPGISTVGVFVNEELQMVQRAVSRYRLDAVQLHGTEPVEYCRRLSGEVMVIKTIVPSEDQSEMEKYHDVADLILFDTPGEGYGGTGRKFDWSLLESMHLETPFFLSGGIGPGDGGVIGDLDLEGLRGIDVNSRFEISPGLKDTDLLSHFIHSIRK